MKTMFRFWAVMCLSAMVAVLSFGPVMAQEGAPPPGVEVTENGTDEADVTYESEFVNTPDGGPVKTNAAIDAVLLRLAEAPTTAKWFALLVMVMGTLRLVLKPLMGVVWGVVKATPSKKDDELLWRIEQSKIFKGLVWVLDYLFSFKLAHPKAIPTAPRE